MGAIVVKPLSIRSTDVLKGVAILLIMAHNFYHHLPPTLGENEFSFQSDLFRQYVVLTGAHPERLARYFFSYFGHIGVQLFVFLTAYGYGMQSAAGKRVSVTYLLRKFVGVYVAFLIATAAYLLLIGAARILGVGAQPVAALDVFYRLILISNFVPHQALKVVGPWWYVSFLLQVMLVLPVIISLYARKGKVVALFGVPAFVAFEWIVNPYLMAVGLNINQTALGFIPLLIFGVAFAYGDFRRFPVSACLLLGGVFVASNFFYAAWMIYDLAFVALVLIIGQSLPAVAGRVGNKVSEALALLGSISLYLFLVNGFLRFPFRKLTAVFESSLFDFGLMLAFILLSIGVGLLVMKGDAQVRKWLPWSALRSASR